MLERYNKWEERMMAVLKRLSPRTHDVVVWVGTHWMPIVIIVMIVWLIAISCTLIKIGEYVIHVGHGW